MKTLIVLALFAYSCGSSCGTHRDLGIVTPPVELTPDVDAGCDVDAGDER